MTKTWSNWLLAHKTRLVPVSIFILGLTVFSGVSIYNLSFKHRKAEDNNNREEVTISNNVESEQAESGQSATDSTAEEKPTTAIKGKVTTKAPIQTPEATNTPGEVKEIHTKETIEQKTVVVVTAAPTATPTTAQPTPTPTPDTSPFEASISNSGETYTVTANKPLQSCQYFEENSGGSTVKVSGNGEVNGNVCTVVRGNPSFPRFGMKVASIYGEEKTFGDW